MSAFSGIATAASRSRCSPCSAPTPRWWWATTSLTPRASRPATRCATMRWRAACPMSRSSCARTSSAMGQVRRSGPNAWPERCARSWRGATSIVSRGVDPALAITRGDPHNRNSSSSPERSAMDDTTRTDLEAAAFRRLVQHLRERGDVQNLDLMNLAGFCRNCLSRWYREAAEERGIALPDAKAREIVYGMPYEQWKAQHQASDKKPVSGHGH